jgi:hypothetical protein
MKLFCSILALEPNRKTEWLHSVCQTPGEVIPFSESRMESFHSISLSNQTSPKIQLILLSPNPNPFPIPMLFFLYPVDD